MPTYNEKTAFVVRNQSTGAPLTSATVQLRRGASAIAMSHVGQGFYSANSVPRGRWEVWIDGINSGMTHGVGVGKLEDVGHEVGLYPQSQADGWSLVPLDLSAYRLLTNGSFSVLINGTNAAFSGGVVTGGSGGLSLSTFDIERLVSADAGININRQGAGGAFWRNLDIFDGKGALVAQFVGSTKATALFGPLSGTSATFSAFVGAENRLRVGGGADDNVNELQVNGSAWIAHNGGDSVYNMALDISITSSSVGYQVAKFMTPNIIADTSGLYSSKIWFGKAFSNYNSGYLYYKHYAADSTNNSIGLGFYGNDYILDVAANGTTTLNGTLKVPNTASGTVVTGGWLGLDASGNVVKSAISSGMTLSGHQNIVTPWSVGVGANFGAASAGMQIDPSGAYGLWLKGNILVEQATSQAMTLYRATSANGAQTCLNFDLQDSLGNQEAYAQICGGIVSSANGNEKGRLELKYRNGSSQVVGAILDEAGFRPTRREVLLTIVSIKSGLNINGSSSGAVGNAVAEDGSMGLCSILGGASFPSAQLGCGASPVSIAANEDILTFTLPIRILLPRFHFVSSTTGLGGQRRDFELAMTGSGPFTYTLRSLTAFTASANTTISGSQTIMIGVVN